MGIQALVLAFIAMAVGTLAPIQMAANAQLAKGVAGTIAATIISFSAGWLFLITINAVGFRQFPTVSDIARTPVYLLLLGGAIGAIFVCANVLVAPRLGSAATATLSLPGSHRRADGRSTGVVRLPGSRSLGRTLPRGGARVRRRVASALDLRAASIVAVATATTIEHACRNRLGLESRARLRRGCHRLEGAWRSRAFLVRCRAKAARSRPSGLAALNSRPRSLPCRAHFGRPPSDDRSDAMGRFGLLVTPGTQLFRTGTENDAGLHSLLTRPPSRRGMSATM